MNASVTTKLHPDRGGAGLAEHRPAKLSLSDERLPRGGFITLVLGVLGVHIANILSETKRRPYRVVRRVHRADAIEPRAAGRSQVARREESGSRR